MLVVSGNGFADAFFVGLPNGRHAIGEEQHDGQHAVGRFLCHCGLQGIMDVSSTADTYSSEILANLIYGPSYISLEYALQLYGLIPERVCTVMSVTTGRSRRFSTPVGDFSYRMVPMPAFASGMDLLPNTSGGMYMVAVPEKALTDKIQSERGLSIRSGREIERYLLENLRLDMSDLSQLAVKRIEKYAVLYRSQKVARLADFVRKLQYKGKQKDR